MSDAGGFVAIAVGAALTLVVVFALWRRLPAPVALCALALAGALAGVGALAIQDAPSRADRVLTIGVLVILTPLHARLVFGRPGERG